MTHRETLLFNLSTKSYEQAFSASMPMCGQSEGRHKIIARWLQASNMRKRKLELPQVCNIILLDDTLSEADLASYSNNYILNIMSICLPKESSIRLLRELLVELEKSDNTALIVKSYKKTQR
jgi:hypothetical protein